MGVLPGIPFRVKGTVMTRATIEVFNPETWEVKVVGTSVGGSNIPFLDQLLDDVDMELPVGSLYEQLLGQVQSQLQLQQQLKMQLQQVQSQPHPHPQMQPHPQLAQQQQQQLCTAATLDELSEV